MKKYLWILFAPVILVLTGCGGVSYPKLYTAENLPQYKDAKVTQVIKNGLTLKDGALFILESKKDVPTIAAYYDEQMKALGWTMPAVNTPTATSYATQYNKGDKYLQLTVSQITGSAQTISINLMQQ
jgi:hypothetical protein